MNVSGLAVGFVQHNRQWHELLVVTKQAVEWLNAVNGVLQMYVLLCT